MSYISGDINVSKMLDIIIDKIKKIPNNNLNIPLSSQ